MNVRRPIDFSAVIKSARSRKGMNQAQLATLCSTTQSAISRVEKTGACQLDTLLRICAVLDLKVDILPLNESRQETSNQEIW